MEDSDMLSISQEPDVLAARLAVRGAARRMGFALTDQARFVMTADELTHSLLAHTGRGNLTIRVLHDGERRGLELVCEEFPTPEARTLAHLWPQGHASRMMDEVHLEQAVNGARRIVCRRWLA